jgi:hypothetical protein
VLAIQASQAVWGSRLREQTSWVYQGAELKSLHPVPLPVRIELVFLVVTLLQAPSVTSNTQVYKVRIAAVDLR